MILEILLRMAESRKVERQLDWGDEFDIYFQSKSPFLCIVDGSVKYLLMMRKRE